VKYGPEIMNGDFDYTIDSQNMMKEKRTAAARDW
jgi:hypothetical protein